jgi:outer membrane protein assembly factor BamB
LNRGLKEENSMRESWLLKFTFIALLAGPASPLAADWTSLRGPNADGSVRTAQLFESGNAGLQIAWKRSLGSGYSAVVVGDGQVFALFADGENDVAAAFDADSGQELWRYPIEATYKGHDGSHDGPISTPVLGDGRFYGVGPRGKFFALDTATGEEIWATHLEADHDGTKPHYGFSSSPVLADGVVVLAFGGGEGRAIAGFDAATGAWKWGVGDKVVDYQSPVVATLAGKEQVLVADSEILYGIDPQDGSLLWSYAHQGERRGMAAASLIPLPVAGDRLFLMHQMDASVMVQVTAGDAGYEVTELWTTQGLRRSYVQPVIHDGFLYGMNNRIFTCISAETGEVVWRSREPGDGFPTLVGDHLVIITKPGTLHIAEATPEEYREVARLDLFEDHSWSAIAYAEGRLYARSMGELARIEPAVIQTEAGAERPPWLEATAFGAFLNQVEQAEDKNAAIDAFLAEQEVFPIIEPSGAVHFVYRGEADDVGIVGDMIGYRREDPMTRVAGTDLFYYSTRLEPDASVQYGFLPNFGGDAIADPLNPLKGEGLFGDISWFAMPGRRVPTFESEAPRKGRLETLEWESEAREGQRTAEIYLPPGYDEAEDRRYPVLYIFDGQSALEGGDLPRVFNHLMGRAAAPAIGVFIIAPEDPRADRQDPEGYAKMILEELVPTVDERYRTLAKRTGRATYGAANGANAALQMALRFPNVFGKVASQGAMFMDADQDFGEIVTGADQHTLQIYQEWGTYHMRSPHEAWSMVDSNRRLWQMLRERGFRPAGGERPEGFGWVCWRGHVEKWLATLFPLVDA